MTAATSQSLSPIELAWFRVQTPENPSVTTVALVCDGPLDPACIKSRVEDRLLPEERLRQTVELSHLPLARPRWQEHDRFNLSDHFFRIGLVDGQQPATLKEVVGQLCSQPLDDKLPLWQIHLVDLGKGGSALILRLHASVADSRAAVAFALRLVDAEAENPPPLTELGLEHRMPLHSLRDRAGKAAGATRMLCQLITSRADRGNPFRRRPTDSKIADWSDPVELGTVQIRASSRGFSATERLLAAVVGALREAVHRQDVPADDMDLRAVVYLDLRQPGDPLVGTWTALGLLGLPMQAAAPAARLEAVHKEVERFSLAPEDLAILGCDTGQSLSMTEIEERSLRLMSQKATLALAIFDGPVHTQYLCGQPISQLMGWPTLTGNITLGISVVTYAGRVQFGVSCDEVLDTDAAVLVADMATAMAET